jgi:hypothetical protein
MSCPQVETDILSQYTFFFDTLTLYNAEVLV